MRPVQDSILEAERERKKAFAVTDVKACLSA